MKLGVGDIPCDIFYIKVKNRQFMVLKVRAVVTFRGKAGGSEWEEAQGNTGL